MPRKARPAHPMTEGSLQRIYDLFFRPLLHYKPVGQTINEWMAHLFDTANRDITRYEALHDFELPGLFCASAHVRYQGVGFRTVAEGDTLWVRRDARNPDWIDVQSLGGGLDQTFLLSTTEWNSIAALLDEE